MSSTWINDSPSIRKYAPLRGNVEADVAIVGGGLTGVSVAYLLQKAGKKVALVSTGDVSTSTSAYTTGFLTTGIDSALSELIHLYGADSAKLLWQSGAVAISNIEKTIRDEHIHCDFMRCSQSTYANNENEWEAITVEADAALKLGFSMSTSASAGVLPFKNSGCMEIKDQAKFDALKYILALKERIHSRGVHVFDETEATSIDISGKDRIVNTDKGSIRAQDVIIATYYPFTKPLQLLMHTGSYITYVCELAIKKGYLKEGLYQDMHTPYHYFRVDAGLKNDRLIIGGEDHRHELPIDPETSFSALRRYTESIMPGAIISEHLRWKWGVIEPVDGLPLIGALSKDPHQYIATGFSGTGITMSRVAADIISDTILGTKNDLAELLRPARVPTPYQLLRKGGDYAQEFLGGALKNALS